MSLEKAVRTIADEMEKVSEETSHSILKVYADRLHLVLEACEGIAPSYSNYSDYRFMREKSDQARRKLQEKVDIQETGDRMVRIVDGPFEGDLVAIPSNMPQSAKTVIANGIYRLRSDGLHFMEGETVKED